MGKREESIEQATCPRCGYGGKEYLRVQHDGAAAVCRPCLAVTNLVGWVTGTAPTYETYKEGQRQTVIVPADYPFPRVNPPKRLAGVSLVVPGLCADCGKGARYHEESTRLSRPGKQWYCGTHAPSRIKARTEAKDEAYRLKRAEHDLEREASREAKIAPWREWLTGRTLSPADVTVVLQEFDARTWDIGTPPGPRWDGDDLVAVPGEAEAEERLLDARIEAAFNDEVYDPDVEA